jgi:hypothetical protein
MVRELRLDEAGGAFRAPDRGHPAQVLVAWLIGGLATVAAVVLGSILALVFAATLAFVLVLVAAALTFIAVAWRIRRPRAIDVRPVIEARKVGHSWVAYGWDQPS